MAKSETDRTTPDLFEYEKRPGRPKTNPLPRDMQLKVNTRNQIKRDKARGLKRVEFKGSSGQLFSINNTTTGTIFSVNDASGSISVVDNTLIDFETVSYTHLTLPTNREV